MKDSHAGDVHEYREDCDGCQIAIMDDRGHKLPDTDPIMKTATKIWWQSTLEERTACNRVWVHRSTAPDDLRVVHEMCVRIENAMKN